MRHDVASPPSDQRFGFVLHDVARLLRKRFEQRARSLGLTRAQWQLLAALHHHEGINQSGLADVLELEAITVARLIDRMEEAGWVERRPDPLDRRAHRMFMTERAGQVISRMQEIGDLVRGEAMAGLTGEQRAILLDLLLRVRGNLCGPAARTERTARTERRHAVHHDDILETTP
jgi:DNA-binding MarR family transcriptional regulator